MRSSWKPLFCIFIAWATSVSHSLANPEFNGRTFSLFTTEGQPFPGTSLNLHIDDLIPVDSGLILFAAVTDDPRSNILGGPTDFIFLLNDDGLTLVASIESEELDGIGSFRFVGLTAEQALLFQATGPLQSYPVYKWENGSLNEFIAAGQTSADIRYMNGNVAYSMPVTAGLSTESIYYGPAGSATKIIDKDLVPNLWSYLGFDGQNVAYGVIPDGGNSNRLDIWQRASNGALSRLFSSGDTIPQEDEIAYDTGGGFFKIEDGVAYVQMTGPGGSRGGRGRPGPSDVHSIFARIENQTPEILINTFQGVDTIGDVEIETFVVEANSRGVIRASLSLDNGDSGLFELKDGLWTQIVPALADFDGTPAIRYELIPNAEFSETIYIRVISGDPRAFPNRVYSNLPANNLDHLIGGTPVDGLPGWYLSDWFGYYSTALAPWLFHGEHGFIFRHPGSTSASTFFFDPTMSTWLWTSSSNYPYLYRFSDGTWLWYQEWSESPRWFLNISSGGWESW